jgi:predicted DNA-binding protein
MSITIDLEPEIERQLRIIAEEEGITIELLVKRIIENYIKEYRQSKALEL